MNYLRRLLWEWLTFTHDVVTITQELVTATQMPFFFFKWNETMEQWNVPFTKSCVSLPLTRLLLINFHLKQCLNCFYKILCHLGAQAPSV
jgi:hypothetical protein